MQNLLFDNKLLLCKYPAMNMASVPQPSFPEETASFVPEGKMLRERTGQELWVSDGTLHGGGFTKLLSFQPQFNGLALELCDAPGIRAVPVRVASYQRDSRSGLAKVLKIGEQHVTRSIGSRELDTPGTYVDVQVTSGGESADGLLCYQQAPGLPVASVLLRLYPGADVRTLTRALFLKLPSGEPTYTRVMPPLGRSHHQAIKETIMDRRDSLGTTEGLLTPDIRNMLEACGDIVYESDARGTDRLVVAFRHIHGFSGDAFRFSTHDPAHAELFLAHQRSIEQAALAIINHAGPHKTRCVLESFHANYADWHTDAFAIARFAMWRSSIDSRTLAASLADILRQHAIDYREEDVAALASVIDDSCAPSFPILGAYREAEALDRVHGDGRPAMEDRHTLSEAARNRMRMYAARSDDQVGVASDMAKFRHEEAVHLMEEPQERIVTELAAHLRSGEICLLPYGAGHLHFGTHLQRAIDEKKSLERYLSWLPKTQVVVVEERHMAALDDAYGMESEAIRRLDRTTAHNVSLLRADIMETTMQMIHCLYDCMSGDSRDVIDASYQQTLDMLDRRKYLGEVMRSIWKKHEKHDVEAGTPAEQGPDTPATQPTCWGQKAIDAVFETGWEGNNSVDDGTGKEGDEIDDWAGWQADGVDDVM